MIRALAFFLVAACACADGVSVSYGAQGAGGGVGSIQGLDLPVGCRVMVGTFDLTPAEVIAAGNDHFTLQAHFVSYATTAVGTFNGVAQGFAGSFSGTASVDASSQSGKRIYLWILDAPDFAQATGQLVFSAPTWTVPAFGSISCQTTSAALMSPGAVLISVREPGVNSATLGGELHQAVALANPDDSDADGDGRSALIEFATGSDPGTSDPLPLDLHPGTLNLVRRVGSSGTGSQFSSAAFHYEIQRSTDLSGWATFDGAIQSVSVGPHPADAGLEILSVVFPAPESGRDFFRVRVTRR